ncbi:hypothetical protein RND81_08G114400 [Saponaria officinalis]|uniref:Uncharacterized protein n=1 Tax=Saponaria officinalis TaxID=3572 RepID=A0AAW1J6J3_SAPOF
MSLRTDVLGHEIRPLQVFFFSPSGAGYIPRTDDLGHKVHPLQVFFYSPSGAGYVPSNGRPWARGPPSLNIFLVCPFQVFFFSPSRAGYVPLERTTLGTRCALSKYSSLVRQE